MYLGPNQLLCMYVLLSTGQQQQQSVHASVFPAVVPRQVDTVQFFSGSTTKLKFTAAQGARASARSLFLTSPRYTPTPFPLIMSCSCLLMLRHLLLPLLARVRPIHPLPSSLHAPSFLSATATWHSFGSGSMLR